MSDYRTDNPFTNGKVVGLRIDPRDYHTACGTRGSHGYIMTRSHLMEVHRCPRRWLLGYEPEGTKATEWGSLIDAMVLDSDRFDERFAVAPETYLGKDGEEKAWTFQANHCKEWREEQAGKIIVKAELFEKAKAAVARLWQDPDIAYVLDNSAPQVLVTAEYHDPRTEIVVPVKILLDLVPRMESTFCQTLLDLKTATDASEAAWRRAVFNYDYHVQAAFYLDVYLAATGEDRTSFLHIVQENFEPWEIAKRLLSEEFVEHGRTRYIRALRQYCKCLATGTWPGYEEGQMALGGFQIVEPEEWMLKQME